MTGDQVQEPLAPEPSPPTTHHHNRHKRPTSPQSGECASVSACGHSAQCHQVQCDRALYLIPECANPNTPHRPQDPTDPRLRRYLGDNYLPDHAKQSGPWRPPRQRIESASPHRNVPVTMNTRCDAASAKTAGLQAKIVPGHALPTHIGNSLLRRLNHPGAAIARVIFTNAMMRAGFNKVSPDVVVPSDVVVLDLCASTGPRNRTCTPAFR